MKAFFNKLHVFQVTAIVAGFCFTITFLTAIYFFKQISNSELFDFTPVLMLLAVAIPAAIFGIIFVQVRAAERSQQVAAQVHARIVELETDAPRASSSENPRRSATPKLEKSSAPEKDPFESL